MEVLHYVLGALAGYFIGNIQFAVIFSRLLHRDDVRRHGSGNAGSTNMLRVYGVKAGAMTFAGDFLKGVAGALLGRAIGGQYMACAMSAGVVLGHNFPVFFGFRGGKGVASSFGIILMVTPLWGGITAALALTVAAVTRTISLASLTGAVTYIVLALALGQDVWIKLFAAFLAGLLVLRHKDNIKRLIKKEEGPLWRAASADEKKKRGE